MRSLMALVAAFYANGYVVADPGQQVAAIPTIWPNDEQIFLHASSSDGHVIAGFMFPCYPCVGGNDPPFMYDQAIRWTPADGLEVIGFALTGPPGSEVYGLSDSGETAVGGAGVLPFRWRRDLGPHTIPLPPGPTTGLAWRVSGDGEVLLCRLHGTGAGEPQRFLWSDADGWTELIHPNIAGFRAEAINFDGSVVVGNLPPSSAPTGAIWTRDAGFTLLLPGARIVDVSSDGTTIVGTATHDGISQAFREVIGSDREWLGVLPGAESGSATQVSDDGSRVFGFCDYSSALNNRPFLWDATSGIVPLDTLIYDAIDRDPPTDWSRPQDTTDWNFLNVEGMSGDGQTFYGTYGGRCGLSAWAVKLDAPFDSLNQCAPDIWADGRVEFRDLNELLFQWNRINDCADLDGNRITDFADLNALLSAYNSQCP